MDGGEGGGRAKTFYHQEFLNFSPSKLSRWQKINGKLETTQHTHVHPQNYFFTMSLHCKHFDFLCLF